MSLIIHSILVNALSSNPLFYIYSGHGSPFYLAVIPFSITATEIGSATNTIFPCVFAFACQTGNFAYRNVSIGESFIRAQNKGGVAYFGSSVNSLTSSDVVIEKKIFGDAFKYDEQNLSAIISLGMRRFSYSGSVTKKQKTRYLKAYNLLGDPSFDIKGVGCNQYFSFNYPEVFQYRNDITYRANECINNQNSFVIKSGAQVKLMAGKSIRLQSGFKVELGSHFEAKIVPCNDGIIRKSLINEIADTVQTDEKYEKKADEIFYPAIFSVFPNPTKGDFSVAYTIEEDSFVQIDIYTLSGVLVKNLLQCSQQEKGIYYYNFSLSDCSSGIYIITLKEENKVCSVKIIKN